MPLRSSRLPRNTSRNGAPAGRGTRGIGVAGTPLFTTLIACGATPNVSITQRRHSSPSTTT